MISIFKLLCESFLALKISWKGIVILFIIVSTLYSKVQILVIKNKHEYGVLMNYKYVCLESMLNCECMNVWNENILLQ